MATTAMSTSASSVPGAGAPIASNNNDNNGRRLSVSPPPPSLERKFELLEARFTQPLGVFGNANSFTNNSNNASFSSPQERGNNSNANSHSNTINNTAGTSENSNLSQHSFSFSGGSNSNSNLMRQPMMTIRSKRNSRSMTSLDIVSRAAAKHMRKVAANSPVTDAGLGLPATATTTSTNTNTNTTSNFSFSSHSGNNSDPMNSNSNSNSQQTVVTGNRTSGAHPLPQQQEQALSQQSQPPQMERVVAESPPVLISPAKASSITKPKVARALQIGNSQAPSSTGSSSVGLLSSILHGYCNLLQ
jgi:hypothetical protein